MSTRAVLAPSYCITLAPGITPHNVVGNMELGGGFGFILPALGPVGWTGCGPGTDITVVTTNLSGAAVDAFFFLAIN